MTPSLKKFSAMTTEEWAEHDKYVREKSAEERAEKDLAAKNAALSAMEIPARVLEVLRGKVQPTEATAQLDGGALIVCLSGNPGNGKTIAAASWLYNRGAGLFVKAPHLARWERYDDAKMKRLLSAPALVVDDLGTEYQDAKGNFMALFDELLDYRYDHRLAMVMTTNLDAAQFTERYGARIVDRIREAGAFASVSAPSMRVAP